MGAAKQRGTFEQRKQQAVEQGRSKDGRTKRLANWIRQGTKVLAPVLKKLK